MKLRYKVALFLAGILGCTALLQRCNKPLPTVKGPATISYKNDGNTIVVKQRGKKSIKKYQPDPKSTVIKTDDKGNVIVKVRQFGVGLEPGIGVGLSDRSRVALDARFAYYKRFSAHTGLGFSLNKDDYLNGNILDIVGPYIGLGYVPWLRFSNTTLVTAYMPLNQKAFIFVRVRF